MRATLASAVLVCGLGGPATATDVFVDREFDRSAWEALLSLDDLETETFSNPIAQADVLVFDDGLEAFDLRAEFTADGGLDQRFFGLISSQPFDAITLIALGTGTNVAFTVDDVTIELPEPVHAGALGLAAVALLHGRRRPRRR